MLEELWRKRLTVLAMALAHGQHDHREIANVSEHIGHDYKGRFLIELIQNANDQFVREDGPSPDHGLGEAGTVLVIATDSAVAVLNQGRPFSKEGLDSVASLAFSPKDAGIHVGNKGVGFKSVYQVTERPMLISRREGTGGLDASRGVPWSTCLSVHPFDDCPRLLDTVDSVFDDLDHQYPAVRAALVAETGCLDSAREALHEAARTSAPFKFPIPLSDAEVRGALDALGLSPETLSRFCTAVVLPVRAQGTEVVEASLAELTREQGAAPGALVLTTPGVSVLAIRTASDSSWWLHRRTGLSTRPAGRDNSMLFELRTTTQRAESLDAEPDHTTEEVHWVGARRVVGGEDVEERRALRNAIQASDMPKRGWEGVNSSPVLVALPASGVLRGAPSALPLLGRISIALPTHRATGSAWFVDGRFHGDLSRKVIDLDTPYNSLLLKEAVRLVGIVLDDLRSSDIARRRLATLALDSTGAEPFGQALWAEGGPARGPGVLAVGGTRWLRGDELHLPTRRDYAHQGLPIFSLLIEDVEPGELTEIGLRLPDEVLIRRAPAALDRIAERAMGVGWRSRTRIDFAIWTRRGPSGASLIERLAARSRRDGSGFWKRFLDWLASPSPSSPRDLSRQAFLPVGETSLARPADNVFFSPSRRTDGTAAGHPAEALDQLPRPLLESLGLLDENAVPVRKQGSRDLSDFGTKLADRAGFVRRPRIVELTDRVVGPALVNAVAEGREEDAAALLALILRWASRAVGGLGPTEAEAISTLRVPVDTPGGRSWIHPCRAYLGPGWLADRAREASLRAAYGSQGRCLVAPGSLPGLLPDAVESLQRLGVADSPRCLQAGRRTATFDDGRHLQTIRRSSDARFPPGLPESVRPVWEGWVEYALGLGIRADTVSNLAYEFMDVIWVDGLEQEGPPRVAVFDLMIKSPSTYLGLARTQIHRTQPNNPIRLLPKFAQLWAWHLESSSSPLLPSASGSRTTIGKSWLLTPEQRRRPFASLLTVGTAPRAAWDLLETLGAVTVESVTPDRLVDELHSLARRLPSLPQPRERAAAALAALLIELLSIHADDPAVSRLPDAPIPLLRAPRNRPMAVDLRDGSEPVYFPDESVRGAHIPGYATSLRLPGSPSRVRRAFLANLARASAGRVILTSQATIDFGFEPSREPENLLDWLDSQPLPGLVLALAATLVHLGGSVADPHLLDGAFQASWKTIREADLVFGQFASRGVGGSSDTRAEAFFDSGTLHADSRLRETPAAIVGELWQLVGQGFRYPLRGLAAALADDRVNAFLAEIPVPEHELHDIAAAIGRAGITFLHRHLPAVYVLWSRAHLHGDVATFQDAVRACGNRLGAADAALGLPGLRDRLISAGYREVGSIAVEWLGVEGVEPWQRARDLLNGPS